MSTLIDLIIWESRPSATQILLWLARLCKWLALPILNFPVAVTFDKEENSNKLEAFGSWLMRNPDRHGILRELVAHGLAV